MSSLSRRTLAAAAATALLGVAGCTGLDEANAAGISRDDLVSAMATQLSGGSAISYTASYQLTGGGTATITRAQRPARTAYEYPGGRLIVTPAATIRCTGSLTCAQSAPDPTAAADLDPSALVTPEAALAMLNAAALDPDVVTAQHDTTVAGRHANCLDLSEVDDAPTDRFTVCVTNEGALAGFTATIKGKSLDLALTSYADEPDPTAFVLPAAATVTR